MGALAFAGTLSAQIFTEDFEGGGMPTGWGVTTNATDGGWNVGNTSALGSANFPMAGNNSNFAGTNDDGCNCDKSVDFLYSADIDLTGQTGLVRMTYKQYYFALSYQGAQEVGNVEVSTNGGTSWTSILQMVNQPEWGKVTIDLTAYAGQTIKLGFRYSDGGGWTYGMAIDDVSVFVPTDEDVTLNYLDLPTYAKLNNGVDVKGNITNNGLVAISSMEIEYTVDGGAAVVANLTGLNVAPQSSYDFTHSTPWVPSANGSHNIEVEVTKINGTIDPDISDNVMDEDVEVYADAYDRTVLYETFTSSTCPPCVQGNINFEGIISGLPAAEVASIKYQMSWPGDGDPYNTADGNVRRGYYSVNSVPNLQADGGWNGNSGSFTATVHNDALEVPAFVQIVAEYDVVVDSQKVRTCATITAMQDLGAATLQIAIIEGKTTQNVGTNGETEFLHVVKKMVADASGQAVTITNGMDEKVCMDYYFQGNFRLPNNSSDLINDATEHSVEEFTDLQVVVWVQNDATMEVYNSANATEGISTGVNDISNLDENVTVFPNPAIDNATLTIESTEVSVATVKVIDLVGKTLVNMTNVQISTGSTNIDLNTANLNAGVYLVEVTINGETSTQRLVVQK